MRARINNAAPTPDQFFRSRTAVQVANWLRTAMETYTRQSAGSGAYDPLNQYFHSDLPISEGFAAVYGELDLQMQSVLRNAFKEVLDSLPNSAEAVPMFKEILLCARRIGAIEILDVLPRKLDLLETRLMGQQAGDRSLFEIAFSVVVDLPAETSLSALKMLLESPLFESSFSGIALDALCRIDPGNFDQHFARLREHLNEMFREFETPFEMKRALVQRLLTSITLSRFAERHAELLIVQTDWHATDNWFSESLYSGTNPIIVIELRNDQHFIAWNREGPKQWIAMRSMQPRAASCSPPIRTRSTHGSSPKAILIPTKLVASHLGPKAAQLLLRTWNAAEPL